MSDGGTGRYQLSAVPGVPRPGADGPWIGSGLLRRADLARLRGDGSFVANMRWRAWLTWPCPRSPADTLVHTINSIITVPTVQNRFRWQQKLFG